MPRVFFVFLFLVSVSIQSQNTEVEFTKSEIFSEEEYNTSLLFAKEDFNGDLYVVRKYFSSNARPKGYYIQHFDKSLNLISSEEVPISFSEVRGILLTEDKIILIEFKYVQKEKRYAFIAHFSPKHYLNFSKKELLSIDRDKIEKYDHYGISKEPEFNALNFYNFGEVATSEDDKYFAINLYLKNEENDSYFINVFNDSLELEYAKTIDSLENEETGEINKNPLLIHQSIKIDGNGNAYVLAKHFLNGKTDQKRKGLPNYTYELFKISKNSVDKISLKMRDLFVHRLDLAITSNKLFCVGYYSERIGGIGGYFNPPRLEGIARFNIDLTDFSIESEGFSPFPNQFKIDKYGKDVDKGVLRIRTRNIIVSKNEELVVLGEDCFISYREGMPVALNYKDIYVFKMDEFGKLFFAKCIKKDQFENIKKRIEHCSFSSIYAKDKLHIFLNAEKEIKVKKDGREILKLNNEVHQLYNYKIDFTGGLSYNQVFKELYGNASLEVRFAIQINDSDLILEAEVDDKPQLFKLSIK